MLPVTSYINPTKIQVCSKCPSPAPRSCVVPTCLVQIRLQPVQGTPWMFNTPFPTVSLLLTCSQVRVPVPALHTCHLTPNPRPVLRSPLSRPLPHVPPSLRTPPCGAIPRTFWISSLRLSPGTSQRYIVSLTGSSKGQRGREGAVLVTPGTAHSKRLRDKMTTGVLSASEEPEL